MGVVVNPSIKVNAISIPANSTININTLGGEGIILETIYPQGQATGETDTFQVIDANGNIYYSGTAPAVLNIYLPPTLRLVNSASGTVSFTGKFNILYSPLL